MEALPSWINPFDFFIILILLGGIALGFIRGLVRMALSLAVLYIAMVVAMTFYASVGRWIAFVTMGAFTQSTNEALSFVLILALVFTALTIILRRTFKDTELPGLRQIDQLGGMLIGFVLISTWIGLCIVALAFALMASDVGQSALRENMVYFFVNSHLIPVFYQVLPLVIATLTPWMPKGLPPDIFSLNF